MDYLSDVAVGDLDQEQFDALPPYLRLAAARLSANVEAGLVSERSSLFDLSLFDLAAEYVAAYELEAIAEVAA